MDTFDRETRSWIMSRVLSRGTKPEVAVDKALREAKCKFSTKGDRLPGNPDFVIQDIRLAVFVNGCFWHLHQGCRHAKIPTTRSEFWKAKLEANAVRDRASAGNLVQAGWRVLWVWECSTRSSSSAQELQLLLELWIGATDVFGEISGDQRS